MSSSFSSLNAALTGLYASQRLIEVSGHNIENMNTPGYTRQRISQKALGISSTPSIFAGSVPQGGGVEMERLQRCGDIFLDNKLRMETGKAAETSEVQKAWNNIERTMDEMSDASVGNRLRDFLVSWGDIAKSPENPGARANVKGKAEMLVDQIAQGYGRIADLWKDARQQVDATVADINGTMDSVAALNARIRKEKMAGADVNELIDQRAQLVLRLSKMTGATARERDDGTIDVMLAGNAMVHKDSVNHLKVEGSADMPGIEAAPKEAFQKLTAKLAQPTETLKDVHGQDTGVPRYQAFTFVDESGQFGFEQAQKEYPAKLSAWNTAHSEWQTAHDRWQNDPQHKAEDEPKEPQKPKAPVIDDYKGNTFIAWGDMSKADPKTGVPELPIDKTKIKGDPVEFKLGDYARDEGPVRVVWENGGHQAVITEGSLGGKLQNIAPTSYTKVNGTLGSGGTFAEVGKLYNDMALNLAHQVNTIHLGEAGKPHFTLVKGDVETKTDPVSGVKVSVQKYKQAQKFFDFNAADNKLPAVLRLKVAIKDPNEIAASASETNAYDGSVANMMEKAIDAPGGTSQVWNGSVVDIGVHTQSANAKGDLAEQSRRIAERAHQSGTGVEMNEEVVNLIQGQHAYTAAARVMSTVNAMLDELVNLGRR